MIRNLDARKTIEALRSGVPSPASVIALGTTHIEVEQTFAQRLVSIQEGKGAAPIGVSATFGNGKSHLLRYLQEKATKEGFVTSFVVVSPEVPLGNSHLVLKAIAEAAKAPGRTGKAVPELASNAANESIHNLLDWARHAEIYDRFKALLHVYRDTHDLELRFDILGDLQGRPLLKTRITKELKALKQASHYDMKSPKNALLAHQRIALLSEFFRCHRSRGLVVFFDEVERIAQFSYKARLAAYEELGWWYTACSQAGSCLFAVFAQTPGAVHQMLRNKGDLDKIKAAQTIEANASLFEGYSKNSLAVLGAEALLTGTYSLANPSSDQMERLQDQVCDVYAKAYNHSCRRLALRSAQFSVRSEIRRWITTWDLERHDPLYSPNIVAEEVRHDTEEIFDTDLGTDANEDSID